MHKLLTCLLILSSLSFAQQTNYDGFTQDGDPLENNILQQEQLRMEEEFQEQEQQNLHQWVASQIQQFQQSQEIITRETFSFQLDQEATFKWNPSKEGNFRIMVQVFQDRNGDIYLPQNPDQHQFISLQIKPQGSRSFSPVGNIYLKKVFHVNFQRDFQIIRIKNNYNRKMLVQVGLQDSGYIPNTGIKDDILKLSNQKMDAIMAQLKQTEIRREKLYKSEWGFKDREERHQSEMLVLTGVELLFILGTAIIQMYCIKNLLQNRSIV